MTDVLARAREWLAEDPDPDTRTELAELIDRATGGDFRHELEARVTGPLGLGRVLGLEPDDQGGIATLVAVGEEASPDELEAALNDALASKG